MTSFRRSTNLEGFTLIELLVGLALGAIVITAAVLAWGISVQSSAYTMEGARVNHDLRATMELVARDLRRAQRGTMEFADDPTDCVAFRVLADPDRRRACDNDTTLYDPECWERRAFRQVDDDIDVFLDSPLVASDDNARWVSLFSGLDDENGRLRIENLGFECRRCCYDIDDVDGPPTCIDGCNEGCADSNWVETLEVAVTLEGFISTGGRERRQSMADRVMVRSNDFELPTSGARLTTGLCGG